MDNETRLENLADALNADQGLRDNIDSACSDHGLCLDAETQDREDIECGYRLYLEEGRLEVSCGQWTVDAVYSEDAVAEGWAAKIVGQMSTDDKAAIIAEGDAEMWREGLDVMEWWTPEGTPRPRTDDVIVAIEQIVIEDGK